MPVVLCLAGAHLFSLYRRVLVPWNCWNVTDLRTAGNRVMLPAMLRND